MQPPLRVLIIGGGTAGWMTAAALAARIPQTRRDLRLVESEAIGTVGVGEATLPHIRAFNEDIGIVESEMMSRTAATFKLGIEFENWGAPGKRYIHPFGAHGKPMGGIGFHHFWHRVRHRSEVADLGEYSLAIAACRAGKFEFPAVEQDTLRSTFDYAYHFDASLYAKFLRSLAECGGVARTEGRCVEVLRESESGDISGIRMDNDDIIEADLFIDCTGFRSSLLGDTLGVGWEDWSQWLPCDRAWAVASEPLDQPPPFTRSIARDAGWQWQIPLQTRTGNGLIYSSRFIDDESAREALLCNLPSHSVGEPRQLRFTPGRRRDNWSRNCIGIGLASGFLEPLESTSIYLIQIAIQNLLSLFPNPRCDPALVNEFNRRMNLEYDRIRDFLILHYYANSRAEPLWTHCRDMLVPPSLEAKIGLFLHRGAVPRHAEGLFSPPSWVSLFFGQGLEPSAVHPLATGMDEERIAEVLSAMHDEIARDVAAMSDHGTIVRDYAQALS